VPIVREGGEGAGEVGAERPVRRISYLRQLPASDAAGECDCDEESRDQAEEEMNPEEVNEQLGELLEHQDAYMCRINNIMERIQEQREVRHSSYDDFIQGYIRFETFVLELAETMKLLGEFQIEFADLTKRYVAWLEGEMDGTASAVSS